jgi:hypothetical protein
MTEEFNKWWNSDGLIEDNPYERDTPAFWAWEGWEAARLAQPEPEPVAWMHDQKVGFNVPLYTAPPQREWQGLTEAERMDILDAELTTQSTEHFALTQAIEAKLKEKNT